MIEEVDQFIKECPTSQKMNTRTPDNNPYPFSNSSSRFGERVQIDTLSISNEGDNFGYKYILVIIDCFTRWISLYPLKTLEAEEAVKQVYEYFNTYGTPSTLQSDQGTQFVNKLMDELLKLSGVKYTVNTAYSKEENGIVERANKEVLRLLGLSAMIED
jgi:transposase InsO family protein